jgi:hypothetical protein
VKQEKKKGSGRGLQCGRELRRRKAEDRGKEKIRTKEKV